MKKSKKFIGRFILYFVIIVLTVLARVIMGLCNWSDETFGVGLEEILYTITSATDGTESGVVNEAVAYCMPYAISGLVVAGIFVVADILLRVKIQIKGTVFKKAFMLDMRKLMRGISFMLAVSLFVYSLVYVNQVYEVTMYLNRRMNPTTLYEDYYVHPNDVNIKAGSEKKNLILLYLESMETTYASVEDGGYQTETYMPHLLEYTKEGITFSDKEGLGGFHNTNGAGWTMAALLSSTSGIPFSFPIEGNSGGADGTLASGLTAMGDILEENGYYQEFLCGSDATFGGRRAYFSDHGNFEFFDLYTAREEGYIPKDYRVW